MTKVDAEDWLNDENEPVLYGVTQCDGLWRYYYWISKIKKFVKLNLSLDHVLVSCSKLNIIYVDLIGFMIYKPLIFVHIFLFS